MVSECERKEGFRSDNWGEDGCWGEDGDGVKMVVGVKLVAWEKSKQAVAFERHEHEVGGLMGG